MQGRVATWGACLLLACAGLSACGGGGSSDNGVSSKSPDQVVSAATSAIDGVKSVHIAGSAPSGSTPLTLDLRIVSGTGAKGTIAENGLSFQLVSVGGFLYINGSPAFWQHFGGKAAASLFNGKWLKAPTSNPQFASISSLTNVHQLLSQLLASHGSLTKGGTSTVNGQKVVAINDTTKGGTLYVATTGKPYPVEVLKSGSGGGHVVFDSYNASVSLTAPANAIDISQLG